MASVMDLDLNCSPPSPKLAAQDDFKRAMLHQEHTFRHQVKDLHRLYWAQKNLSGVPFWKQSDDVLYARHSPDDYSQMTPDFEVLEDSYGLGKQAALVAENLGVEVSVRRKPDTADGAQGKSAYRCVIDLEKPAALDDSDDDDVEIISSAISNDYTNQNGGVILDYSQRLRLENSTLVCSGSIGSSNTPESHSPVKAKTNASGCMLIDLNIAQEDDLNVSTDPSKMFCSLLASATTVQSTEFYGNSNNAFHRGSQSSLRSSKGSSITSVASMSVLDSSRKVIAAGHFDTQSTSKPFYVGTSKPDALLRGNVQHRHTVDEISRMGSEGCTSIPGEVFSVRSNGGNSFSSGLHKLEPAAVRREHQQENFTVISDDEMEGIDLNVSVGSIEFPSTIVSGFREKRDGTEEHLSRHFIQTVEYPAIRDHMAESMDGKSVQSPDPETTINRSILIPETPQGRDYACPRLSSSNTGATNPVATISMHPAEAGEDEKLAATAADTLISLFRNSSSWVADSHCSNNQADAQDGSPEPQASLDSFEEGVMNLEEMKEDGESTPVRAPDKDGPSCGIKLKRGRGMRDFQREILPGLVSLARHEICDDLHAIGYEIRKSRSRRAPGGDKCASSTRSRLPRRCSKAWN